MKHFLIALICLAFAAPALAQTADTDPATKDDVIIYLRTMHSHDMMQKMMDAMLKSMRKMRNDMGKDANQTPADLAARNKQEKEMAEIMKGMPMDEIVEAMIPTYQKHFTRGDIAAMTAFYSSPVGQKVLEELPAVTQESMQAAMPIMSKYITDSMERMKSEPASAQPSAPASSGNAAPAQN